MKNQRLSSIVVLSAACACMTVSALAIAQDKTQGTKPAAKEVTSLEQARGTFDVKMTPQADDKGEGAAIGRASLEKTFQGDLDGVSTGEMLTAVTGVEGSAGYVALERVKASLRGRVGTFVLQHSGTMARGEQQQSVTVVPDSGTGDLAGLNGRMTIQVAPDGTHSYEFQYVLLAKR